MSRPHATYANVVSTLALLTAVAGGGLAAAAVAANSVGSAQIKNGAIKGADVKANTLTSKQVKDATLQNALMVSGPATSGVMASDFPVATSVTFRAPSDGFVLVTAQAELSSHGSPIVKVRVHEGPGELFSTNWDPGDNDGLSDLNQSASAVLPVKKGTHTYDLRLGESGPDFTEYGNARLVVVFTAQGKAAGPPG